MSLSKKRRRFNLYRQSEFCFYCGDSMQFTQYQGNRTLNLKEITIDHIIPKCKTKNKRADKAITVGACHNCNQIRGKRPLKWFKFKFLKSENSLKELAFQLERL